MPASYISLKGRKKTFDLDSVVDFVAGKSGKRPEWKALIVYVVVDSIFIELRDAPPDLRGNSKSESEEVTEDYLVQNFSVTHDQIKVFKLDPKQWQFIDHR